MTKKILTLDGNNFFDLESFYKEVDRVLTRDLDWETGHNLDALNDLFRGGFGVYEYEEPVTIIWKNSQKSKADLGFPETIKHYSKILSTCHPSNKQSIEEYLSQIKNNEGETLFAIILKMIKNHEHIDLKLE